VDEWCDGNVSDGVNVQGDDGEVMVQLLVDDPGSRSAVGRRADPHRAKGSILAQGWTYPDPFKSRAPFHKIFGDGRVYLSLGEPSDITLALRVQAEKIYGSFPFYEAAFIGGSGSLRGFNRERFAGDAAVVGSAELRFSLFRMKFLVPTEVGLFVLGDAGRVWVDGDTPGSLHTDAGGGIWLAPLERAYTFSVAVASSVDDLFVRAGVGFGF